MYGQKLFDFTATCTVADRQYLDAMLSDDAQYRLRGTGYILARWMGIDSRMSQQLASGINDGQFRARPQAGVDPENHPTLQRWSHEDGPQVLGEDLDGHLFRLRCQLRPHFAGEGGMQQPFVGIRDDRAQTWRRRRGHLGCQRLLDEGQSLGRWAFQPYADDFFALGAIDRQHPVRRELVNYLGEVIVVGVLALAVRRALFDFREQRALIPQSFAYPLSDVSI